MARESKVVKITLPLDVNTSKRKKFILNQNAYRNAHFRTLSAAKRNYSDIVFQSAPKLPYIGLKCEIEITYYPKTLRRVDLSNVCSVCDKFATDALTRLGYWEDDDVHTIPKVTYLFGGLDRENPRFEYVIKFKKTKNKGKTWKKK